MDQDRFDGWTRALAAGRPRRGALRLLLAGALGARLGPVAGAGATHAGCRHDGAGCGRAGQCCSGRCTANGTCQPCARAAQCPQPANPCKRAVCDAKGRCAVRNNPAGTPCRDAGNPCTADICDGSGACTHPALEDGTVCGTGKTCQGGACACEEGLTPCGDQCVDLDTSNDHCGACNTPCKQGTCTDKVCVGNGPQGCPAVEYFCATQTTACPQSPSCTCATDIQGNAACARFGTADAFCPRVRDGRECAQNADCGAGFVCIKATAPDCYNCGTIGGTSCQPVCA